MAAVDSFELFIDTVTRSLTYYEHILALIGTYYLTKQCLSLSWRMLRSLRTHLWSRVNPLNFHEYGQWAVVTDATDDIGYAYACQFAKQKINIIIIDKDDVQLSRVAKHLIAKYNVSVETIVVDLGRDDYDSYKMIRESIRGKSIGILINNVHDDYVPNLFLRLNYNKMRKHINAKIMSCLMMTHMILPQMVSKGRGIIVNLSSLSSIHPLPLMSCHSSSNAFIDHFTRSLSYEYKSSGVIIQCILKSHIRTKRSELTNITGNLLSLIVPSPESFVSHAVKTIGHSSRSTGYWPNDAQFWVYSQIPEWLWLFSAWHIQKRVFNTDISEYDVSRSRSSLSPF